MVGNPTPDERTQLNQVAVASGLGCSIVVSVVVTIGGGALLDRAFDTTPILTLIGVALGLIAAGYQLYELAQMGATGRETPPITRGLAKLPVVRKRVPRPGPSDGRAGDGPGAG